ncbi:MAG: hypothetical protein ABSC72_02935 [Methylovirgula sp.]|jgi:hypothetical protein
MREVCVSHELHELDSLVGLGAVKAQIARLALRLSAEQSYRAQGAAILPAHRHLVFSGPVGVGKRRVAQAFGEICARLGALRKGHLVTLDPCDLDFCNPDKKILLMREKCDEALDGILYVSNEAFLSAGILRSRGDLRLDPVDVMIDFMVRHRSRVVVVLDARHKQFDYISFHSGLARLFSETISFEALEPSELIQILAAKAREQGLDLPDGIECELMPWIVARYRRGDWRNAREMSDLLSRALALRTQRAVRQRCASFGELERRDFRQALAAMRTQNAVNLDRPNEIPARLSSFVASVIRPSDR